MGNDHDRRKLSKKKGKREGRRRAAVEEAGRRIRFKPAHKKSRAVTKSLCYGVPPLPPSLKDENETTSRKRKAESISDDQNPDGAAGTFKFSQIKRSKASEREAREKKAAEAEAAAAAEAEERKAAKVAAKPKPVPTKPLEPFIAAKKWLGAKLGYHFSRGKRGLGYYLDPMEQKKHAKKLAQDAKAAAAKAAKAQDDRDSLAKGTDIPAAYASYLADLRYDAPMPMQTRCWEGCAQGRDVLVVAPPGSGKTLAYLLPGAAHAAAHPVKADSGCARPAALVLVPTRELAVQVMASARLVKKWFKVSPAVVYGGTPLEEQSDLMLKTQPGMLIATPGRVQHLLQLGSLNLGSASFLVLDEADKMLQLGFQDQLAEIRAALPQKHRTLMLSATFPESVQAEASEWLERPLCIKARAAPSASAETSGKVGESGITVTEVVHVCAEHKKPRKLMSHLTKMQAEAKAAGQRNVPRTLVFANTIKKVKFIGDNLSRNSFSYHIFHGKQNQKERERVLSNFKAGKVHVLVSTDVAGRGLHISGLEQVVNWDFAGNLEQHVHRVGRTGRNNMPGHAFTFFTRNYAPVAPSLCDYLQAKGHPVDPNLLGLAKIAEQAGVATTAMEDAEDAKDRAEEPAILPEVHAPEASNGSREEEKGGGDDGRAATPKAKKPKKPANKEFLTPEEMRLLGTSKTSKPLSSKSGVGKDKQHRGGGAGASAKKGASMHTSE